MLYSLKKAVLATAIAAVSMQVAVASDLEKSVHGLESTVTTSQEDHLPLGDVKPFEEQTAWTRFIDDSTMDVKFRLSNINMTPSDISYDYAVTRDMAVDLVKQLTGLGDRAAGILVDNLGLDYGSISEGINNLLADEVKKNGDINQGGLQLWTELRTGYLFDLIGFDLGYQGGSLYQDDGEGGILTYGGAEGYGRASTANVKMRLGSEEKNVGARYGRVMLETPHFDRDPDEWLLDKTYEASMLTGQWGDFSAYAMDITAYGDITGSGFIKVEDRDYYSKAGFDSTHSVGLDYFSDYGMARFQSTWSSDYMTSNTIQLASGLPIAWLGANVPTENEMDYLLIFQIFHNWQEAKDGFVNEFGRALPDHEAKVTDVMLGFQADALFVGLSYTDVGDKGWYQAGIGDGGLRTTLAEETLINQWHRPNQQTYTFAMGYNWKNAGLPGLDTSMITAHSRDIDMNQVLQSGDLEYYLTGEKEFTETLFEAKYKLQGGPLEGLSMRGIYGFESNQAKVSGFGIFVEYNATLF